MTHSEYYTIVSISLTSFIPVIYGIVFSFTNFGSNRIKEQLFGISFKGRQISAGVMRMIYAFILSFLTLLFVIRQAEPVPSEGWLRTLLILILFSAESVFVYSFIKLSRSRPSYVALLIIVLLFFAAMPFGLTLCNPWNYFMFISPFYWLGWAWIIPSPGESFAYAVIGAAISILYLLLAGWFFRSRKSD
jgi:hypothetical protein